MDSLYAQDLHAGTAQIMRRRRQGSGLHPVWMIHTADLCKRPIRASAPCSDGLAFPVYICKLCPAISPRSPLAFARIPAVCLRGRRTALLLSALRPRCHASRLGTTRRTCRRTPTTSSSCPRATTIPASLGHRSFDKREYGSPDASESRYKTECRTLPACSQTVAPHMVTVVIAVDGACRDNRKPNARSGAGFSTAPTAPRMSLFC
jgi:hypothetical protein